MPAVETIPSIPRAQAEFMSAHGLTTFDGRFGHVEGLKRALPFMQTAGGETGYVYTNWHSKRFSDTRLVTANEGIESHILLVEKMCKWVLHEVQQPDGSVKRTLADLRVLRREAPSMDGARGQFRYWDLDLHPKSIL